MKTSIIQSRTVRIELNETEMAQAVLNYLLEYFTSPLKIDDVDSLEISDIRFSYTDDEYRPTTYSANITKIVNLA